MKIERQDMASTAWNHSSDGGQISVPVFTVIGTPLATAYFDLLYYLVPMPVKAFVVTTVSSELRSPRFLQ